MPPRTPQEQAEIDQELRERMREECEGLDRWGDEKEEPAFSDEPPYVE